MSTVYATEPETTGRVIFETTHGPLEVQLWCRECPRTTRLFLQLCLDGYYDDMIFHRIVPDFLIQTGALRATKTEGCSDQAMQEYRAHIRAEETLNRRRYELHSRLRFNHRGQVAMALELEQEDPDGKIQPQFFITLDEAPYLDSKHVLFGTVSGPTIFNAIRMGKVEIDEATSQPVDLMDAPRIKSVRILDNPLHSDIVQQTKVPWKIQKVKNKKKKREGRFDTNVLSFGDEIDETQVDNGRSLGEKRKPNGLGETGVSWKSNDAAHSLPLENGLRDSKKLKTTTIRNSEEECSSRDTGEMLQVDPTRNKSESQTKQSKNEKEKRSVVEEMRSRYAKKHQTSKERQNDTMAKLFSFKNKVKNEVASSKNTNRSSVGKSDDSLASRMARRAMGDVTIEADSTRHVSSYHGQILHSDDESSNGANWMATEFKCRKHLDHLAGLAGDGRAADDYEVVDETGGSSDHEKKRHRKKHKSHRN